jgi:hypothetical protein
VRARGKQGPEAADRLADGGKLRAAGTTNCNLDIFHSMLTPGEQIVAGRGPKLPVKIFTPEGNKRTGNPNSDDV